MLPPSLTVWLFADIILNMNFGFTEMIFIFLLALLIFGPRKLPEIGRQLGRTLAEFKRASNEFKNQIEDEVSQLEAEDLAKKSEPPPDENQIRPPLTTPEGAVTAAPGAPIERSTGEHNA